MRIGFRISGPYLSQPYRQLLTQELHLFGILHIQRFRLGFVYPQIIKFIPAVFVIMNQLPVALPYDGRRFATLIAIMRIMPV